MAKKKIYPKEEYNWITSLIKRQKCMLKEKEIPLSELYNLCDTKEQRNLVEELLVRFHCFEEDIYNLTILDMADYIAHLGYDLSKTAIVAFCKVPSADSSQTVLDHLKVPLCNACNGVSVKTINQFGKIYHNYQEHGIRHFIAVDEFAGSGKTLKNRYNEFLSKNLSDATIDFCLLAGMDTVTQLASDNGIPLHISYEMKRGVSGYYSGTELSDRMDAMKALENKLADIINQTALADHSFGYGQAEALYSRLYGNIPNNVFPLIWWKAYKNNKKRETLFTRVQDGY